MVGCYKLILLRGSRTALLRCTTLEAWLRAGPPADQRQEMSLPQMKSHRITAERVKNKPQVPNWSDTPHSSAPGESKRRDRHTHHPLPVTQQQLNSAGPSKKNFVHCDGGELQRMMERTMSRKDKSRADEDKAKEATKKDDAEKRMPASHSRGGSGGRFEANRGGRGGRGGNGYSSGNVSYRGCSREYRQSRTERGPCFDCKKDDGSEESSSVEEEKPINRLCPRPVPILTGKIGQQKRLVVLTSLAKMRLKTSKRKAPSLPEGSLHGEVVEV
ncbi:hypothetical protein HPB51_008786 [Rhipicephalus microplus]|uniref:Uncharacterized protein n=1 Tax=Rhipicephalus microplus TaxID=6941 RepID=A0A9J6D9Q4_RHIMP|nr:hypothetical protein HPB51_008786 [Rhipicephalus microplus]